MRQRLWSVLAGPSALLTPSGGPVAGRPPAGPPGAHVDVSFRQPGQPRADPGPGFSQGADAGADQSWADRGPGSSDGADDDAAGQGAFSAGHGRLSAFDPGRRGVKALAAVAAAVVLIAGFLAWRARPATEPVPESVPGPAAAGPAVHTPAAGAPSAATEIVVAVAGKVRKPGLVRLLPGSCVADAIESAGGAKPGVDVALLNPARKVVDGELIVVGANPPPPPGGPAVGAAPPGGRVNLNTATLADLDTLPGVGPVLAQRILAHRDQHGGFRTVADLRTVDGIGDSRYEQLKDLVTV